MEPSVVEQLPEVEPAGEPVQLTSPPDVEAEAPILVSEKLDESLPAKKPQGKLLFLAILAFAAGALVALRPKLQPSAPKAVEPPPAPPIPGEQLTCLVAATTTWPMSVAHAAP